MGTRLSTRSPRQPVSAERTGSDPGACPDRTGGGAPSSCTSIHREPGPLRRRERRVCAARVPARHLATLGGRAKGTQRPIGGAGRDSPAHSDDNTRLTWRGPASPAPRRGLPRAALVDSDHDVLPLRRGRPAERGPFGRRDRPQAVRGRVRAPRAAVSRQLRVGRQPPERTLRGRAAAHRESGAPPACDPERVRASGERVPTSAPGLHRRPALPRRLPADLGRGHRRGPTEPSRRRSSLRRVRETAFASTIPSSQPTASSASSHGSRLGRRACSFSPTRGLPCPPSTCRRVRRASSATRAARARRSFSTASASRT